MHRQHRRALQRVTLYALAAALLVACGGAKSGRADYVKDGDSGAASPGTTLTPDNPRQPDSTLGVGGRTGAPGAAGDTSGSRGKATLGTADAPKPGTPPRGGRTKP
jgi:hypothetical protein